MRKESLVIATLMFVLMLFAVVFVRAEDFPAICGQPIDPKKYKMLEEDGQLPVVPEMSDFELAQKLALAHPALTEVKEAVTRNDLNALQKSLGAYLNTRIPPYNVKPTGKTAYNASVADPWLANAKNFNWWAGMAPGNKDDSFTDVGAWLHPLGNAYEDTGDPKYAEAILEFIRSFYHNCRPLRKPSWGGRVHPALWAPLQVSGRMHYGYFDAGYRSIGTYSGVTDADRVMFLKLFWESTDFCYRLTETHSPHNIEVSVLDALAWISIRFPEFRDSERWRERSALRFGENMNDCIMDDGGAVERTGYHFAYMGPYLSDYKRLKDAGTRMPPLFTKGLERMLDWTMWMLAPTLEYPLFGHGGLGPMNPVMEIGPDIFPERTDFAWVASGGKTGSPPAGLAKTLWRTGRLTMRSDWSRDALYMALCYNLVDYGNAFSSEDHLELLSFGIWAYGQRWMSNSGSTASYSTPEYRNWCTPTISCNSVLVNHASAERFDNSGRIVGWANIPATGKGFNYLAVVGDGYRRFGVSHRRTVLFIRPESPASPGTGYWLMSDVLTGNKPVVPAHYVPPQANQTSWKPGDPYEYSWLGHFQPTQLTIDPVTKSVSTSAIGGKRFYLVPARPDTFKLEEKEGPIITLESDPAAPLHPNRRMAPYVLLTKAGVTNTAFQVLLYPTNAEEKAPQLTSLVVQEAGQLIDDTRAVGLRIKSANCDDLVAIAVTPALRKYGSGKDTFSTDGEVAYLRRSNGRILSAGLAGGQGLVYGGEQLIKSGPGITAVHVSFESALISVSATGNGGLKVRTGNAKQIKVNDEPVRPILAQEIRDGMLTVQAGSPEKLKLTPPKFSRKPEDLVRAVGVPGPRDFPNIVAVSWTTDVPADALIEYRLSGENDWRRSINPEFLEDHLSLLGPVKPGEDCEVRLTCYDAKGRRGYIETQLTVP